MHSKRRSSRSLPPDDSKQTRRLKRLRKTLLQSPDAAWPQGSVLPQCRPQPRRCCALVYAHGIHPQCPNLGSIKHRAQLFCAEHFRSPAQTKASSLEDLAKQAPIRGLLRTAGVQGIDDNKLLTKAALLKFAKDNKLAFPLLGGKVFKESKDNVFQFIYLTSVARGELSTLGEAAMAAGATMSEQWRGERCRDRPSGTWHDRLPAASHGTTRTKGWDWKLFPCSAMFKCPRGCPARLYGEYMKLHGLTRRQVKAEAHRSATYPPAFFASLCQLAVCGACMLVAVQFRLGS
jgi:hypothetical protein